MIYTNCLSGPSFWSVCVVIGENSSHVDLSHLQVVVLCCLFGQRRPAMFWVFFFSSTGNHSWCSGQISLGLGKKAVYCPWGWNDDAPSACLFAGSMPWHLQQNSRWHHPSLQHGHVSSPLSNYILLGLYLNWCQFKHSYLKKISGNYGCCSDYYWNEIGWKFGWYVYAFVWSKSLLGCGRDRDNSVSFLSDPGGGREPTSYVWVHPLDRGCFTSEMQHESFFFSTGSRHAWQL